MTFGSDETFALIKEILSQETEEAYEPLCKILYEDIAVLLRHYSGIQAADKEDLMQNVVYKVVCSLPGFYEHSAQNTEQQRNSYLKKIVYNEYMSFIRKEKREGLRDSVELDDDNVHMYRKDFSVQSDDRLTFFNALNDVFKINTTPDKLLAFVYNRLIDAISGTNGSPKSIIEEFDGKPLQDMYERMVIDLESVLDTDIPEYVLSPLKETVYGKYFNTVFHMSAHRISDSSQWIVEKAKECNMNEYR